MILLIDNYDSFTYNLAHLVKELGAEVTVIRNDQFTLNQLEPFDKFILSPGPGIPSEPPAEWRSRTAPPRRRPHSLGFSHGHRGHLAHQRLATRRRRQDQGLPVVQDLVASAALPAQAVS